MSIGENIRHLRKRAKLTQKQLAQMVGVNEVTIRSYERGKYEPKRDVLYRLVKALDCNINELEDKPFTLPDLSMENFEEIEGTGVVMIQKNLPPDVKEKIKEQLLKSVQEIGKSTSKRTITIDTSIDENHPFNILQKKIDNGEELTLEEFKQYREHIEKSVSHIAQSMSEIVKSIKDSFDKYYAVLNDEGQQEADTQIQKAVEKATKQAESQAREDAENQIKLLTRIPEYQKKPDG